MRAFTLIELLTVIAIITVLAGILIPVVGSVRKQGAAAVSRSNLRQCMLLLRLVADENKGTLPYETNVNIPWVTLIWPYAFPGRSLPAWENDSSNLRGTIFYDPGIRYAEPTSTGIIRPFAANVYLHSPSAPMKRLNFDRLPEPTQTMMLGTATVSSVLYRSQIGFRFGNHNIAHFVFIDGHVEARTKAQMQPYIDSYEHVFWKGGL